MGNRTGLAIIVILFLHSVFTYLFSLHYNKAPLRADIDLAASFSGEYPIHVPIEQIYEVKLEFERGDKDFDYLNSLLGIVTANPPNGIPLNVIWTLSDEREMLLEEHIQAYGSCGWSQMHVNRCLGKFSVPPGNYIFKLAIRNPDPEFKNLAADLTINFNFKNAHAWQTGYIFFAQIFNYFVTPVVGGLILLFLIFRHVLRT